MDSYSLKVRITSKIVELWLRSLRTRLQAPAEFGPGILGLWHQDVLACVAAFKDKNVHILISESKDGEFLAATAQRLGYKVTRGSDTHGSSNVRHVLDTLKKGGFAGMALDGPRGPALQEKPGSVWLSKSSGRPLWLLSPRYGRHLRLKNWDKMYIPLPLTSIDMRINYFCENQSSHCKDIKEKQGY
ncbi:MULTISPECIES: lysophospholipid acyltransferase family protein [unclassified Fibrobacter]|uniref:lysophospholipid acyltransferase family protein n=1 Tax=unclassified Fibrobacter TaxID=2634177 RepID=UPI000D6C6C47|nr:MULTISPECIES: DUF374 domain-containing protein [unclassified Fibrobacter]PWJ62762.1 hypothetical protein BGX12_12050 [Fibrobacter sp. UWR4]PZW66864.1 hypothetical protein C8E88_102850 [Fibrobacter sp. UWR1]